MRWIVGIVLVVFALILWLMIDAATPRAPAPSWKPAQGGVRERLTGDQCRIMAEHLKRDHGLKVRVLSGTQVIDGVFVWQDLTVKLADHPGFVFSYPHYLGNLRGQEILEEKP